MSGVSIRGNDPAGTAGRVDPPVWVQVRRRVTDGWELLPEAVALSASTACGSEGVDRLSFRTVFGVVKHPFSTAFAATTRLSLIGWWARIVVPGEQWWTVLAVGIVQGEEREDMSATDDARGRQTWTAVGVQQALRQRAVCTSYVQANGVTSEVGSLFAFNSRNDSGVALGNRSAALVSDSYVFGGTSMWTRRQVIDYLLDRYGPLGVSWSVHGQTDALDTTMPPQMVDQASASLATLIDAAAPRSLGIDWRPVCDEQTGIALEFFRTNPEPVSFEGVYHEGSARRHEVDTSTDRRLEAVVVSVDTTKQASAIRAVGERIVVCGTLRGSVAATEDADCPQTVSLEGAWSVAEQASFQLGDPDIPSYGSGNSEPYVAKAHDTYRSQEGLSHVFACWRLPASFRRGWWAPKLTEYGTLTPASSWGNDHRPLTWLPIHLGTDFTAADWTAETTYGLERPFALIQALYEYTPTSDQYPKLFAEDLGFTVSIPRDYLGVTIRSHPPGRLSYPDMQPATPATPSADGSASWWLSYDYVVTHDPLDQQTSAQYDYRTLRATIAWRTDERVWVEWRAPDATSDSTAEVIEVPGAELWVVAPGTLVGAFDPAPDYAGGLPGQPVSSGSEPVLTRDDRYMLRSVIAGALARYAATRQRAELRYRGILPLAGQVGAALWVTRGSAAELGGVVTSVEWDCQRHSTILRAGYA